MQKVSWSIWFEESMLQSQPTFMERQPHYTGILKIALMSCKLRLVLYKQLYRHKQKQLKYLGTHLTS